MTGRSFLTLVLSVMFVALAQQAQAREIVQDTTLILPGGAAIEMVWIPGGTFQMGDQFWGGDDDEKPVHTVTVGDFYLGATEVTVGQYMQFAGDTRSRYPEWLEAGSTYNIHTGHNDSYRKLGSALTAKDHPVVGVSWHDASAYCDWLSQNTGDQYRLPTEAEWEYAARSGGKKEKWAGTSSEISLDNFAWYDVNSGNRTHPVGQKQPNGLGLYDMSGNVWEWCSDWYGLYPSGSVTNPTGPSSGTSRAFRGGSWDDHARLLRCANRLNLWPDYRYNALGFRLAKSR